MPFKKPFRVCGVYDTETCNIMQADGTARAYPVCYILNDISGCDLSDYVPDVSPEVITIVRTEAEALSWFDGMVSYGKRNALVPVICAYNLMFDLQTVLQSLANSYGMQAIAQSATNAYCVDLTDDEGNVLLRFWDTFHLELNGLEAMGRTCGFAKAVGSWDYSLIRTPGTPLTDEELEYAVRDVQVIPAYLRYLLEANDWLEQSMFGQSVITKTSLVRRMARSEIGSLRFRSKKDSYSLYRLHELLCLQELPADYRSYALRKACFRGGFTFTAAAAASRILRNVHSIDVTSMHHTYINGRRVPVRFQPAVPGAFDAILPQLESETLDDVLRRYDYPFPVAFHGVFRFRNLRLKKGSAFDAWKIALIAQSKFGSTMPVPMDYEANELNEAAERWTREAGWHDSAIGTVFAFGKLYEAEECILCLTEVEYWNVSRVYEWDSVEAIEGEVSIKTTLPPDYVTLQSNILYERKNDAKVIDGSYIEGESYPDTIPSSIPAGIAHALGNGTISNDFFHAWYQTTVKGAFNGIYGTQAMDVFRPDFAFDECGDMFIDGTSKVTPDNFLAKRPKKCTVLYTYGMRIVAGSRQHLVIAIELLWRRFGNRIIVTGGDTDSLKVSTPEDISPDDILQALAPLEDAIDKALAITMQRIRKRYPDKASDLNGIGHFDYEGTQDIHLEAWNKARVSVTGSHAHITCAGLRRPAGAYHMETWIEELLQAHPAEKVLPWVLGYNGTVTNAVCHMLEHYRPSPADVFDADIADYTGKVFHVHTHEAIALYPAAREMGGLLKQSNADNISYLASIGTEAEQREHVIGIDRAGKAALWVHTDDEDDLIRWF